MCVHIPSSIPQHSTSLMDAHFVNSILVDSELQLLRLYLSKIPTYNSTKIHTSIK